MRLSDIKGERVFEVIADIVEPVYNIATDPVASQLFKRGEKPAEMDATEWALFKVKQAIPSLMREHKADMVAILSTLDGKTPEEYMDGLTMPTLLKGVYEMLTDEDLLAFLS